MAGNAATSVEVKLLVFSTSREGVNTHALAVSRRPSIACGAFIVKTGALAQPSVKVLALRTGQRLTLPRACVQIEDPDVVVVIRRMRWVLALAGAVGVVEPLLDRQFVVAHPRGVTVYWLAETATSSVVKVLG